MHPALTGDRHTLRYTADGRIVAVFRHTGLGDNPTKGDFVAWVGAYEAIVTGRGGQYHVRLLDNKNAWDCGYPGLEVLPDDTLVATTYGHRDEGEQPYIKSVRFTLLQLDGLAEAEKPTRPRKSPQEARRRAREDRLAMALNTLVSYRPTNQAPADPTIVDAQRMLRRAIPELVGRDGPVTRRLASLVAERRQQLIPTRQNKIRERDPLARILVRFDSERTRRQFAMNRANSSVSAFDGRIKTVIEN